MQECGCNHSSNIVTTDSKRSKKENMFDFDVEVQIHVLQDFGLEAILLYEFAKSNYFINGLVQIHTLYATHKLHQLN